VNSEKQPPAPGSLPNSEKERLKKSGQGGVNSRGQAQGGSQQTVECEDSEEKKKRGLGVLGGAGGGKNDNNRRVGRCIKAGTKYCNSQRQGMSTNRMTLT